MTLNSIYHLSNLMALIGWVLLLVSVFRVSPVPVLVARHIPAVLAIVYIALMLSILPFAGGGFGSIDALAKLFGQPEIALVGWIHYLCFDLFIGAWELNVAKRQLLSKIIVVPSLLLTLLLGPFGLLFFLCARYFSQYRVIQKSGSQSLAAPGVEQASDTRVGKR